MEEADELIKTGKYKDALALLSKILLHPEGIRPYELSLVGDSIQYAIEKSIQATFAKLGSTVF